jgi:Ca-activated chloride channel family protein
MRRLLRWIACVGLLAAVVLLGLLPGCGSQTGPYAPIQAERSGAWTPGAAANARDGSARTITNSMPVVDELWIIEAKPRTLAAENRQSTPPALLARSMAQADQPIDAEHLDKLIPVPLKHTDVKASIAGYIAAVDLTQQYVNPFAEKIEATYVFPLPHNSAVNEFVMVIGERRIRGIIRERAEARRLYEEARGQGYVASLLTQERPNIFTQTVGNIEPGKQIDIQIRYYHTLAPVDGWYEFAFPMVVGPRFNPPASYAAPAGPGLDDRGASPPSGGVPPQPGIGAVARGAGGISGQATEVQYLRPGERSGHDISLTVTLDGPLAAQEVQVRTHPVTIDRTPGGRTMVALASAATVPNRDFVLRYRLAGGGIKPGLIAHKTDKGGYFTLLVVPPASQSELRRGPVELIFTLDVSGSMSGRPIEQARQAIRLALGKMQPGDTFNIVRFAGSAEMMSAQSLPADRASIARALDYVNRSEAGGGTMMLEGIRKSLLTRADPDRLRFVVFLTDGYIGNEAQILAEIERSLGPARIFSFGVGTSTNRYLLERMAKVGRGAAAYLDLADDAEAVMAAFFERISHPALTDLALEAGGNALSEVYPRRIPDLFAGRPVTLTGRYTGELHEGLRLRGRLGGQAVEIPVPVVAGDSLAATALPSLWARARIADVLDDAVRYERDAEAEVRGLALEYGLMSPYTAFIAVDASRRTEGEHGTSVAVPVPMPEGVRYETTVQEPGGRK